MTKGGQGGVSRENCNPGLGAGWGGGGGVRGRAYPPPLGTSQLQQAQAASLRSRTTFEVHSAPRSPAENQALRSA